MKLSTNHLKQKFLSMSFLSSCLLFIQLVLHDQILLFFYTHKQFQFSSLFLTAIMFLYFTVLDQKGSSKITTNIFIVLGFACIYALFVILGVSSQKTTLTNLILFLIFLFHRSFNSSQSDKEVWYWQNRFVRASFESIFFGFIICVVFALIYYLLEFVFATKIPQKVWLFSSYLGMTSVVAIVYLFRINEKRKQVDKFQRFVINYVIKPVWVVYVILLCVYALRIMIEQSLPKGLVAYPVIIAFAVYTLAWWGGIPLLGEKGPSKRETGFFRCVKWMHFILIALFWFGVIRRVSEYGMTEPRFLLVVLGIMFTSITCLDLNGRLSSKSFIIVLLIGLLTNLLYFD